MDTPTPTGLGPVLKQARVAAGLLQQEMADALGVTLWTYNRLENGHRYLKKAWLQAMPLSVRIPVIRYLRSQHEAAMAELQRMAEPPRRVIRRPTEARAVMPAQ